MPTEMHNPAHPGQVLQEYLEGMNITHVAKHLHVSCEANFCAATSAWLIRPFL